LRYSTAFQLCLATTLPLLSTQWTRAMDMRFDVATFDGGADGNTSDGDTDWFYNTQMQYLNFPSANGHQIDQSGSTHLSTIQAEGNTLGTYYNDFDSLYSSTETPAEAVSTIESYIEDQSGSYETGRWLVLNEVSSTIWNNATTGSAYRTWLVSTMSALHSAGYNNIILYAPFATPGSTFASTWQQITQYASIGDECYVSGQTAVNDNFSVSTIQQTYQSSFNSWVNSAGIAASKLILGEEFTVNLAGNSFGADGVSGTAWQEAIEARDLAIHNIPFGGFIGYAWDKNAQATGDPGLLPESGAR
jgi:hypothetical protein